MCQIILKSTHKCRSYGPDKSRQTDACTYNHTKIETAMSRFAANRLYKTKMVAHRQHVEPAVRLSDLYDVFLLDIVRDTRQNLWTMIYRSDDLQIV